MTMMDHEHDSRLQEGMLVYAIDGKELGRIKDMDGECFKLDAPYREDYWLSEDAIDSIVEGLVRLRLTGEEVEGDLQHQPHHRGLHLH